MSWSKLVADVTIALVDETTMKPHSIHQGRADLIAGLLTDSPEKTRQHRAIRLLSSCSYDRSHKRWNQNNALTPYLVKTVAEPTILRWSWKRTGINNEVIVNDQTSTNRFLFTKLGVIYLMNNICWNLCVIITSMNYIESK